VVNRGYDNAFGVSDTQRQITSYLHGLQRIAAKRDDVLAASGVVAAEMERLPADIALAADAEKAEV
jgi:hypothetical protein